MYGKAGFALLRQRVLHRISRPRRIWHTRCIVLPRTSEPTSDRSGFELVRYHLLMMLCSHNVFTDEFITKAVSEPSYVSKSVELSSQELRCFSFHCSSEPCLI